MNALAKLAWDKWIESEGDVVDDITVIAARAGPAAPGPSGTSGGASATMSSLLRAPSKTANDITVSKAESSVENRVSFSLESNDISVVDYKLAKFKFHQKLGDEFFGKDLYDI